MAVSIHAARAGGDSTQTFLIQSGTMFQSTPPARAATPLPQCAGEYRRCFNPRRPRGRRPQCARQANASADVSIHAARAGGDSITRAPGRLGSVSIHAARAGGDKVQSRRAARPVCFNPRRPRGRRRNGHTGLLHQELFQSTPPARAATSSGHDHGADFDVSIHAARAGGDFKLGIEHGARCFNPRRPRGRRLAPERHGRDRVSIHAARAGGDADFTGPSAADEFQSTPPARAATQTTRPLDATATDVFQSTPPARAATDGA